MPKINIHKLEYNLKLHLTERKKYINIYWKHNSKAWEKVCQTIKNKAIRNLGS